MKYMKVHASLFPHIHVYEWLYNAFICMFLSYDFMLPYINVYKIKIKRNPLRELMFLKTLKIESMHVHLFIIKPKVARTMTMTL